MTNSKVVRFHLVVVLQVPRTPGHPLALVEREQVPAFFVFGRLVASVSRQLCFVYGAVGQIYASSQCLHLSNEPVVLIFIRRHVLKKLGDLARWSEEKQAVVEGVYRSLE
jgi:hypothetical protein